jgi:hypothetical protein
MSVQLHDPAALPLMKEPSVPNGYEVERVPEPVCTQWSTCTFLSLTRNRTPAVHSEFRRYTEIGLYFTLFVISSDLNYMLFKIIVLRIDCLVVIPRSRIFALLYIEIRKCINVMMR